jgi:hypothetical protein
LFSTYVKNVIYSMIIVIYLNMIWARSNARARS